MAVDNNLTHEKSLVEVQDLTFAYQGCLALKGASFTISQGTATALIGANGAGKTTLMRCLAGLATPLSGCVRVMGRDPATDPLFVRRMIGFLPDLLGLDERLTVRQCLRYQSAAHDPQGQEQSDSVQQTARDLGIDDLLDHKAGALSRGQAQKVAIGQVLIHRPPLLILDEPASGLDPEARFGLSHLIRQLCEEGSTILVSSHILGELEDYATAVLIIEKGRIIDQRSLSIDTVQEMTINLELAVPMADLAPFLEKYPGISEVEAKKSGASFIFAGDKQARSALLRALIEQGAEISLFAPRHSSTLSTIYRAQIHKAHTLEGQS